MAALPPLQKTFYGKSLTPKKVTKPKAGGIKPVGKPSTGFKVPGGYKEPTANATAKPEDKLSNGTTPTDPMPLDVTGLRDYLGARATTQANATLAGLQQQENQTLSDAGFTAQYQDVNGVRTVSGLSFDPSNPFSRAALLQRSYNQRVKGNTNGMAAQGQLYSGALQNAQNETAFDMQQSDNALKSQVAGALNNISQQRYAAEQQKNNATTDAGWQALLAALGI